MHYKKFVHTVTLQQRFFENGSEKTNCALFSRLRDEERFGTYGSAQNKLRCTPWDAPVGKPFGDTDDAISLGVKRMTNKVKTNIWTCSSKNRSKLNDSNNK